MKFKTFNYNEAVDYEIARKPYNRKEDYKEHLRYCDFCKKENTLASKAFWLHDEWQRYWFAFCSEECLNCWVFQQNYGYT